MQSTRDSAVAARMELAFELYEVAEQMMRQNLRRRFPGAGEPELERRLLDWLRKRSNAAESPATPD